MRISFFLRSFVWPTLPSLSSIAPNLSLTAQDGAWIRSEDFTYRKQLLLLFTNNPQNPETLSWIRAYDSFVLEQLPNEASVSVFVISPKDTKTMREFRDAQNLTIEFLYDPLSIEARRFGMSKRRLSSCNGVMLIDEEQKIRFATRLQTPISEVRSLLSQNSVSQKMTDSISSEEALILMNQGHILIDVRTRSEYEAHHSPEAIHIPIEDLSTQIDELPQKNKLIFICQAGERAIAAADLLRSLGSKDVLVVAGGMTNWNGPQQHGVSTT